jgi:hypothetical protein
MPYGYSAAALRERPLPAAPAPPAAPRRRLGVVAALLGVGCCAATAVGIAAAELGPRGLAQGPAARAVREALVSANVVIQNLGAPAPGAASTAANAAFALRSHTVLAAGRVRGGTPPPVPLPTALGRAVLTGQRRALAGVFAGSLLASEERTLAGVVAAEEARASALAAPGGARVVRWYSVTVSGATARAEAVIARWEQQDRVAGAGGTRPITTSVVGERVDATATLRRSGGRWRLVSLSAAPWQEPT